MFTWIWKFFTDVEVFKDTLMLGARHREGGRTVMRVLLFIGLTIGVRYWGDDVMGLWDAIEAAIPGLALGIGSQPPATRAPKPGEEK